MKKVFAFTGLVCVFLFLGLISPLKTEGSNSSLWLEGEPLVSDLNNHVDSLPNTFYGGNVDCTDREIITKKEFKIFGVSLPFLNRVSHESCSIKTKFGAWSQNGYLTRNGTDIGGEIYASSSNSRISNFHPIPNSNKVIRPLSDGVRLYSNFDDYLTSIYRDGQAKHFFDMGAPFEYIEIDETNRASIDTWPIGFSANGRYLITEALSVGIIRYDLETHEYKVFEAPFNHNVGIDPSLNYAITSDGRHAVVASSTQPRLFLFDLNTCAPQPNKKYQNCEKIDLSAVLNGKVPNLIGGFQIRFLDDYTIRLYLAWRNEQGQVVRSHSIISAKGHEPINYGYLALGDSFASGEGAYEYKSGTDVKEPLNKCHVSNLSYPYLIGEEIGLNQYESIACSGAVIDDLRGSIVGDKFKYSNKGPQSEGLDETKPNDFENIIRNFLPGYTPQLNFIKAKKPKIITVSISGNDIGFGDIINRCIFLPDDCYTSYEERYSKVLQVNEQYERLLDTYRAIKELSPRAKIYAIGYPSLAKNGGVCERNVSFSNEEIKFFNDLVDYLNLVIRKSAEKAGVVYVDAGNAFEGYRLCEGDKENIAVNGLTLGDDKFNDIGPIGKESFHPNANGHELLKKAVLEKTQNFAKENPPAATGGTYPLPSDANNLLEGSPYKGGAIYYSRGFASFNYSIDDFDAFITASGFAPGSFVNMEVHSDPVSLGEFKADENGLVKVKLKIPDGVAPGFHTLYVFGKNIAGEPTIAEKIIFIPHSANDYDGDGILNENDPCLVIDPAGIDEDKDGIDDACDGIIGLAPAEEIIDGDNNPDSPSFAGNPDNSSGNTDTINNVDNSSRFLQPGGSVQGQSGVSQSSNAGSIQPNDNPLFNTSETSGSQAVLNQSSITPQTFSTNQPNQQASPQTYQPSGFPLFQIILIIIAVSAFLAVIYKTLIAKKLKA